MLSRKKILIVGSGPSSLAFLKAIIKKQKCEVDLIDSSSYKSFKDQECVFIDKFAGSRLPISEKQPDKDLLISNHFGGFSTFWGGTFDDPSEEILNKYHDLGIDLKNDLKEIDGIIPQINRADNIKDSNLKSGVIKTRTFDKFTKQGFIVKDSNIAVSQNTINLKKQNNKKCNICKGFEWSCKPDTIWNSGLFLRQLIDEKKINYFENSTLISFKEAENKVLCKVNLGNHVVEKKYDKLIIACGPVGTSKIFLKSKIFEEVIINSSDLLQIPFIKLFKNYKKQDSFADLFSYIQILKNMVYSQIYFFSNQVLLLSSNTIPFTKLLKFVPNLFLSLSGGIFIYLDTKVSSKIRYTIMNDKLVSSKIDGDLKKKKAILKVLKKKHLKINILFFPFLKKEYLYGTSYHLGAQFPISLVSKKFSSDSLGRVGNCKNVHVVDASVLPDVNIGPVTKLIMANSFRIGKEMNKQ
ncbi:hypothetical protein CM15mP35_10180 [bacterium]|nr:MAG: hypothetical protein CM15mP35_10180 [bacterium]